MKENENDGYHFDKIIINSSQNPDTLKRDLPPEALRLECHSISFRWSKRYLTKYRGYYSDVRIIAPTQKCLELLRRSEVLFGNYSISYIEIAHDTFCSTTYDAELQAQALYRTLRKKYSYSTIYRCETKTREQWERDKELGLFAEEGSYSFSLGKKRPGSNAKLKQSIYARNSKINMQPCVHEEWRTRSSALVKSQTGIENISHLIDFDFEQFFSDMTNKYSVREEINRSSLGRFLTGYDGKRYLTKRQLMNSQLATQTFCNSRDISTYSDLVRFFKAVKNDLYRTRGRRSILDEKILNLKNYNRFKKDLVH